MTTEHPSFYQLDQLACGVATPGSVKTHVESCGQCGAYLSRLEQTEGAPVWARKLAASGRDRPSLSRWRWVWGSGLATAMTAAALLLVFRPNEAALIETYTTVKGAPSVGLYIKRESHVSLWNGRSPILPGDRIRLKIVPEGYRHVAVFAELSGGSNREHTLLFKSELAPNKELMLPTAWEVDAEPGDETIVVVMSHDPVDETHLPNVRRAGTVDGVWTTRLTLHKESH